MAKTPMPQNKSDLSIKKRKMWRSAAVQWLLDYINNGTIEVF